MCQVTTLYEVGRREFIKSWEEEDLLDAALGGAGPQGEPGAKGEQGPTKKKAKLPPASPRLEAALQELDRRATIRPRYGKIPPGTK